MKIDQFDLSEKVMIIAELSANHGGDIEIAKQTILAAKEAGADAIKLQTYTPDTLTIQCDNDYFKIKSGTIWDGRTLYELYQEAYTPWEWHEELMCCAKEAGLLCFSTPFDKTAVDFLETLNVPAYKVASFEIMDIPLIEYIAAKHKPVIMSTGIASLGDIEAAVNACRKVGNDQIILLKCTSSYPAKIEDANLATIPNMRETFNTQVGLSDHTLGITASVVSVALGARVIEKHFILDSKVGGPDASFSLDPERFKEMVAEIRLAELSVGKIDYADSDSKMKNRLLGRSLFVVENMKKGEIITEKNVRSIRPNYGLAPKYLYDVLGKKIICDVEKGTPLSWNLVEPH